MLEELFDNLKSLGRQIIGRDKTVVGVKFIIFFKDGKLMEYNSRQDENLGGKKG